MIKEIITDEDLMSCPCIIDSEDTESANDCIIDLMDTAYFHIKNCVGLSANQIGYNERIIVVYNNGIFVHMINPKITLGFGGFKSMKRLLIIS